MIRKKRKRGRSVQLTIQNRHQERHYCLRCKSLAHNSQNTNLNINSKENKSTHTDKKEKYQNEESRKNFADKLLNEMDKRKKEIQKFKEKVNNIDTINNNSKFISREVLRQIGNHYKIRIISDINEINLVDLNKKTIYEFAIISIAINIEHDTELREINEINESKNNKIQYEENKDINKNEIIKKNNIDMEDKQNEINANEIKNINNVEEAKNSNDKEISKKDNFDESHIKHTDIGINNYENENHIFENEDDFFMQDD